MGCCGRRGDDRLEQKAEAARYDSLRCWPFRADFDLAAAAKCADNSVTIGMDARRGREAVAVGGMCRCERQSGVHERAHGMMDPGRVTKKVASSGPAYTKKVRSVCWKAAMGHGRRGRRPGDGRGLARPAGARVRRRPGRQLGRRAAPNRAVRILLWPRSKRFQMRCQVRSLSWQSTARMAARMPAATARWRNRHRAPVVRLSRRILSASQTLKVRPQPGRALRLLQKIRRARTSFAGGCCRQSRARSRAESACRRPCSADRASA